MVILAKQGLICTGEAGMLRVVLTNVLWRGTIYIHGGFSIVAFVHHLRALCMESSLWSPDATRLLKGRFSFGGLPMSWQATNWVITHSKQKGSALLTMLCIANCANESGANAFPGLPRLARDTRMSVRQVGRIIEKLGKSGELTVTQVSGRSNHYSFPLMSTPAILSGVKGARKTPDRFGTTPDILAPLTPDIAMTPDPSVLDPSVRTHTQEASVPLPVGSGEYPEAPPESSFVSVGNVLARIGAGGEFDAAASRKKALAARPGARRRGPKPAPPVLIPVPDQFFESLSSEIVGKLTDDLNLNRGYPRKLIESWQRARQDEKRGFESREAMIRNLRKFLVNYDINHGGQRRAS